MNSSRIKGGRPIHFNIGKLLLGCILASFVFISCENNLEVVQSLTDPVKVPDATINNYESLYYDSARLMAKINAPILLRFSLAKDPYLEFPSGIHVELYDTLMQVNATVTSKYAIYKEKLKLWEARNDVVVVNRKGERLNTEQLFWDQNKKIIYSQKFCRILSAEASLTGDSFHAREDFTGWSLSNVKGPLKVKDE